jgi:Ca2+-binding EF-hand superfamily protein
MKYGMRFLVGSLAVFGLMSGAAWAAHHEGAEDRDKGHHARMFTEKDTDGNGEISLDEWLAGAQARFVKMDADGNGSLTQDEMKAAHTKMKKGWKDNQEPGA